MNKRKVYKIAVIEPSPVIREGIKALTEASLDFQVMKGFPDFDAFEDGIKSATYDAILINPAVISVYKNFSVKNLFSKYQYSTIIALIYGYVDQDTLGSFDGAIDIYLDGQQITKKLKRIIEASSVEENNGSDNIDLSDREKEILVSVAKGLTNKEIAEAHNISVHTVISHRKNISRKTGIKTVSGLTVYALFNNLISQNEL